MAITCAFEIPDSLQGCIGIFAETEEGRFTEYIDGEEKSVTCSGSSMRAAAVVANTTGEDAVPRLWMEYGKITKTTNSFLKFTSGTSGNAVYPRSGYTYDARYGSYTIIDEHGTHVGTPSGTDIPVYYRSSYTGCVGVMHTSTDDGYIFKGWKIECRSASYFEIASSGYKRELSGNYIWWFTEDNDFVLTDAVVLYDTYGSSYPVTITALYEKTVKLSFDANGGEGAPDAIYSVAGDAVTIPNVTPTYGDNLFKGWATSSDATEAEYIIGDTLTLDYDITLFAVWEATSYIVSFDANGGEGAPESITVSIGSSVTIPSATPTKEGASFLGWNTEYNAESAQYQPGSSFTPTDDTVLYAIWDDGSFDPDTPEDSESGYIAYVTTTGLIAFDPASGYLVYA